MPERKQIRERMADNTRSRSRARQVLLRHDLEHQMRGGGNPWRGAMRRSGYRCKSVQRAVEGLRRLRHKGMVTTRKCGGGRVWRQGSGTNGRDANRRIECQASASGAVRNG